jgi:4-hydroxybenzoate polyprenyltransferase
VVVTNLGRVWQLLRAPNLLIVFLTQYLLAYRVLYPALREAEILPSLGDFQFSLLVLTTVLLTASGYVINDIYDQEVDHYNRPKRQIVGRHMQVEKAWLLYAVLTALGCISFTYLGFYLQNPGFTALCPILVFLLWWYSYRLKGLSFLGNLVVAFLCALVAGILWLAEDASFQALAIRYPEESAHVRLVFGGYILFAFLTTLFREMIKDLEDRHGDERGGLKTLPVRYGVRVARNLTLFIGGVFLLGLALALGYYWRLSYNSPGVLLIVFLVMLPFLYVFDRLWDIPEQVDYRRLSSLTKWVMAGGLLLLLL